MAVALVSQGSAYEFGAVLHAAAVTAGTPLELVTLPQPMFIENFGRWTRGEPMFNVQHPLPDIE